MFGAGSDTTASAISIGIMASACYPEAQAKEHEELDNVIGRDCPPTLAAQDMLPQMMAFILETYRWRPVSAGATKDIIWKNYRIPKGASVMGNVWSVGHDPAIFPDPEAFNPQRWLDSNGRIKDELKLFTFGFGRRVCPGQHIANVIGRDQSPMLADQDMLPQTMVFMLEMYFWTCNCRYILDTL